MLYKDQAMTKLLRMFKLTILPHSIRSVNVKFATTTKLII